MNGFFKLWLALNTTPATFIQALIAMAIATVYALIRIALFGGNSQTSFWESVIILFGSVALSGMIMKKINKARKK